MSVTTIILGALVLGIGVYAWTGRSRACEANRCGICAGIASVLVASGAALIAFGIAGAHA